MSISNQASLLRRESFGGTLGNAVSGKRIYVNTLEFQQIKDSGCVPSNLQVELRTTSCEVIIREPETLLTDNFSAPDTVFFELTRECNLDCTHCLNDSGKPLPAELTHERRSAILDEFCTIGVQEVRFTGGEPLLVAGLFNYISKIRTCGLRATMGTNGVLIDTVIAQRLSEAGLNMAVVSVDGLEHRHDLIRGVGTFQKTIEGIELLRRFRIPVRVNVVAMKSSITEIPDVVRYFYERRVPIMIRRLVPSGRADGVKETPSAEDYRLLRDNLQPLLHEPKGIVSGHYLKEDEVIPRIKLPFVWCKCKAGRRGLAVLPDGRVSTCGFLEPLHVPCVGNLSSGSLSEIWKQLHVPITNCIALAVAGQENLVQVRRVRT